MDGHRHGEREAVGTQSERAPPEVEADTVAERRDDLSLKDRGQIDEAEVEEIEL